MDVSAVVPAYNEETYIGQVLDVIVKIPELKEIIVVNDGSTDNTAAIVKSYPVKLISLEKNIGKGGAMLVGARAVQTEYVLFLDADLVGLRENHIYLMLEHLQANYDMIVGIFDKGRKTTDWAQVIAPFLSGQRIVKKELLFNINNLHISRFGVEVALTKYASKHKLNVKEVILKELSHVMKEEKLGLFKGFLYRLKMYWEIAKNVAHG
jgi:glycosyltransferase involved in cell wall biosynthesis